MSGTNLAVSGLAARSHPIGWDEIAALPGSVPSAATVAPGAVGVAAPLDEIVALAGPDPSATHCTVVSRDGAYTASIPLETLVAGGWLAYGMEGAPLPVESGGPLRLTVAAGDTLCWNVKDVGELRFTSSKEPDSVPENPPH